jgi:predicted SprT family Zn-dependent metalloprotease
MLGFALILKLGGKRMDKTKAKQMAEEMLRHHGLNDWAVEFSRAVTRLGQCRYRNKTINLSEIYVELNTEANVLDTILHEVAHALVGPGQGHGFVWARKAKDIGCSALRCRTSAVTIEGKYKYECPNCKMQITSHRRKTARHACKNCCDKYNHGKFSSLYVFQPIVADLDYDDDHERWEE